MKKKIIPVVIVIIALLIGCVGYICYTNNEVKKYSAKIEKQLDKMDQLKGEAYFLPEEEDLVRCVIKMAFEIEKLCEDILWLNYINMISIMEQF